MAECLSAVLCSLSAPARAALADLAAAASLQLEAQKAEIEAALLALDVAVLPVEAAAALAQEAIDELRAVTGLVPVQLMAGCFEAGAVMTSLDSATQQAEADLSAIVDAARRKLSFRNELERRSADISAQIDNLALAASTMRSCP